MRRSPNLDSNHAEVVNALRGLGASVQSLASLGRGVPDVLIGAHGINIVAEIKAFPPGTVKGEPNEEQRRWIDEWRGQVVVIRSLEDVGRVIEMAKRRAKETEIRVREAG